MVEAISSIPRITSKISHIEDTLKNVQKEMAILSIQLREFDDKNVAGSEELSRLDTLKSNMENCRSILMEHSRWNSLVTEAKNFMESGGRLSDSADR
jgi:archaellum component FlaC